jgi:alanine-glyoxylate transaminase/serine-glyoxylate transaminase/serine-pyruvate transaminase
MPGRHFLFVPGPTNVPDRVFRAMHRAMEDHRSPAFPDLLRDILSRLPQVMGTKSGRAFVFAATGTGMWEAALVNTLNAGARVLAPRYGQFAHLFISSATRLGYDVNVLESPWGLGAPATAIHDALVNDKSNQIAAVLVVHNETSTGVTSDIGAVRRAIDAAKHPALLIVDGVSSIGSLDFRMDEWRVDVALAGSQKGFMMPAGLGILGLSEKALARVDTATSPRAFFDLRDQIKHNDAGYTAYTPALSLLFGLQESLNMLFEEGLENVVARHSQLANGVRAAVAAWNLELCARDPKTYSNTVSAVMLPGGESPMVMQRAFHRYQLSLGAGLGEMAGKLFRIGHLGDLNPLMLIGALGGAEMALRDAGIRVAAGSGVAAAEEVFRRDALDAVRAPDADRRDANGERRRSESGPVPAHGERRGAAVAAGRRKASRRAR